MASVSVVSATDFRANLLQTQSSAPEGEEPFSQLLNSVADVRASAQRPDAPKVAERRKDAPVKQQKPEADADRQAKRQAKDTTKPEANAPAQSAAPTNAAKPVQDDEVPEGDDQSATDAAAMLMIALGETEQSTAPEVAPEASGEAELAVMPAAPADAEAAPDAEIIPALAAAMADGAEAASEETQAAALVQSVAGAKPKADAAQPVAQAEAEAEITLPKITAETISSLMKPVKAESSLNVQTQTQPGPVNLATAAPLQGPAPLEMLNAAINKHVQLSLGLEGGDAAPDAPKLQPQPQISSNAVAPNFALTAQANAPVQAPIQAAAESVRAVPVAELAVEIATRAAKGERRFDIRLDPPELGRIDVRLEIDSKGNTTTKLIVERSETLDMLQRDARGLEKALQNAGLKLDAGGMQFSLQQDAQTQQGHQNHAPEMRGRPELAEADAQIMTEISAGNASLAAQIRGGVDIRI